MANPAAAVTQARSVWEGMSSGGKITLVLGLIVGLGGFGGLLWWSSQSTYVPLMTGLSQEDAAAIVEKLGAAHSPYQLGAGGSTVLVPETMVYDLRLKMAAEGLPRGGGVGFEIFNEPSLGQDRFTEELNYQRALEGELQRTLRTLEGVKDARVHVVLPKKGLFERKEDHARASVTVHMHSGRQLAGEQVQAIVHLVSSSVAGLTPEDVTVVDGSGQVMAKGGDTLAALGGGLAHQRAIEQSLEARVGEILERVVGQGKVAVRVTATLDFSQREDTTETYDPESAVIRSEQVSEEEQGPSGGAAAAAASNAQAGGIPGARSNLAGAPGQPTTLAGAAPRSGRKSQTRNFELNKSIRKELQPQGRLQRLSVAVIVDGIRKPGAGGAVEYTERTPEELARFTALVQKAVGFDGRRGDEVEVQSMAFEPAAPEPAPVSVVPIWVPVVMRMWPALLATTALGLFIFLITRRRASRGELVPVGSTVRELEAMMTGHQLPTPAAPTPSLNPAARVLAEAGRPDPAHAAAVIKGWLAES
jgi:flagellar M-ring protein FliF